MLSMLMCIQNLVRFCQFVFLDIERKQNVHGMTEPRIHGTTEGQGESSIAPLFQSGAIMTGNNPKLDLVNVDVHTKFGQILSIHSQDIERKQNSDIIQGL